MDHIDRIIAFETGELDEEQSLTLLQEMVDDGTVWKFQGSWGRTAADLLNRGVLRFPEQRTHDYYGNAIPTRSEWEALHPDSEDEGDDL
jgi:hypothetical protein